MFKIEDRIKELNDNIVLTAYELVIPVYFSDGFAVKEWFSRTKARLIKRDDNSSRFVYFVLNNRRKIAFELKKQEMLRFVLYGKFPTSNDKKARFYDGSLMGNWFRKNRDKLIELSIKGDEEASLLLKIYNKPKRKSIKYRKYLTFDEKVLELYKLLIANDDVFDRKSKYKFSDGVDVKFWVSKVKDRFLALDTSESKYILERIPNFLSFENKLKEFLIYISENRKFPSTEDFSDGVRMNNWFYNNRERIYLLSENDEVARLIVDVILSFKPNYFAYLDDKDKGGVKYGNK